MLLLGSSKRNIVNGLLSAWCINSGVSNGCGQLNFLAAKICWCVCKESMCFAKIISPTTLKKYDQTYYQWVSVRPCELFKLVAV